MEKTGTLSVAMCTYNGEKFLKEQLDSILGQSFSEFELVIVDDCSTDNSLTMLLDYQQRDARVRVLRNESNLGFRRNFEKALRACRGEYIALADQDDIWFPEKLDTLMKDIGDNLLIYSRVAVVDEHSQVLDRTFPKTRRLEGDCALSLILGNCVTGHASLIRRELRDLAMPLMRDATYHDQLLAVVAASQGRLKAGQQVLSYYRLHRNNAVLGNKKKAAALKVTRIQGGLERTLNFVDILLNSSLLSGRQRALLEKFALLYRRNRRTFYNLRLRRFLKNEGREMTDIFYDRDRKISRLCRGVLFYRCFPFA